MRILLIAILTLAAFAEDLNDQLLAAARRGDAEAVRSLLEKGANVNAPSAYSATPLNFAAANGHLAVVRLLLDKGADPGIRDTFYKMLPINRAMKHPEVVKLLLEKGSPGAAMVLSNAVGRGDVEMVRLALARCDCTAEALSNALGAAQRAKRTEIAALLIEKGAVPPPQADFAVDAVTLASYAGSYRSEQGAEMVLALKDGKLTASFMGQPASVLGAFDQTRFRPIEIDGISLEFQREGDTVTGVTLRQGGGSMLLRRAQ
ncbi:MAG: ankyrin repeat domain-containing protein [Bryobacteraceae bacterium]